MDKVQPVLYLLAYNAHISSKNLLEIGVHFLNKKIQGALSPIL